MPVSPFVPLYYAQSKAAMRSRVGTGHFNAIAVFCIENGYYYIFDDHEAAEDDNDINIKPNAIDSGDPGRWIKVSN